VKSRALGKTGLQVPPIVFGKFFGGKVGRVPVSEPFFNLPAD
jgi:hypothetical protein